MKLPVLTFVLLSFCPVSGQERYSVIIQELMPDPSPTVGLPASEWIEVRNRGRETVNLQGWRIADGGGLSGPMPALLLEPDSMLLVCGSTAFASLSVYGRAVAVTSFPSLDNDGDLLVLLDSRGATMHALRYDPGWFGNDLKKEGGWSLEMIDGTDACTGRANWTATVHPSGGTPGQKNSTAAIRHDQEPPVLLRTYTINDSSIRLLFNETVDSLKASLLTAYNSSDVRFGEAFPIAPLFEEVELRLLSALLPGRSYQIAATGLCDCAGNTADEMVSRFGKPASLVKEALVINEILFNPVPSGYDYIEVLNPGDSILDLSHGFLANRNTAGDVAGHVPLSREPRLIFPGEYYVLTGDPDKLQHHFHTISPDQVYTVPSMPSFPDDKGVVILAGSQGEIIDEVAYSQKWHFPLIRDATGVALERVNALEPAGEASNWHSASTTSGYGTPTSRNSQVMPEAVGDEVITVVPAVFSPDNDGIDDQCFIYFNLPSPDYVAQVTIYNLHGVLVKKLVQGGLTGSTGYWNWDGLNEKGQANPPGPYILLTTLFNLDGRTIKNKSMVILASR